MASLAIVIGIAMFHIVNPQRIVHDPNYCYSQDPIRPQNGMHASESSYEAIRRPAIDPNVSTCTPSRFWYFGRHGGRIPETVTLNRIFDLVEGPFDSRLINNYMLGRTALCVEDFELMRGFYPNFTREDSAMPTEAAFQIMKQIAQHYQSAFPTLLPPVYDRSVYLFRHAASRRTQASAEGFCDGLFGINGHENVEFEPVPEFDSFLRPHSLCPAFIALGSTVEVDAFQNGPEFRATISQVNEKLGFLIGSDQLSVQEVLTLWQTCTFIKAKNLTIPSAMCPAFSVANNEVLEFREDLSQYYGLGYGIPDRRMLENLTCGLLQNLLRFIQSNDVSDERARVYVSTYADVTIFAVSLGLFEDEMPPSRHSISRERLWKSSWISPTGAHIAVVRYDCTDGENEVAFFYNERPVQIPGCMANGLCKVNYILQRYNRYLNANCDALFCTSD